MKIELRPRTDANGNPIYYQSQLPPEQQQPKAKPHGKTQEPTPEVKREVAAPIAQEVQRVVPPADSEQHQTVAELEARLRETEAALADARRREKERLQAEQAASVQAQLSNAALVLIPLQARLKLHTDELDRVQKFYGPILRDFARSCAGDQDLQVQRKVSEIYAAAGPVGQKLGEARKVLDDAARGLVLALNSSLPHVHEQARVLAEAACALNILSLETECKVLIEAKAQFRGARLDVSPVTEDHRVPSSLSQPRALATTADLGRSLI